MGGGCMRRDVAKVLKNSGFVMHAAMMPRAHYIFFLHIHRTLSIYPVAQHNFAHLCIKKPRVWYKDACKACQRLLEPNAVTAQLRLAKYDIKGSPGFSIFVPGDLHTNNLGDFLAVRYT
jgi:hypothetical protein